MFWPNALRLNGNLCDVLTGKRLTVTMMAAAFLAAPVGVSAKTNTGTMAARVQVDTSCRLNTEPLTFGTVNLFSGQVDATTNVKLSCGPAVAYSVAIDNGQYYNGQRRMYGGVFAGFQLYVPYEIYRNAARTQVWGSTAGNLVTGTTPANGDVTLTAYGRVPNSLVLARPYLDTVTVTVNF